MPWATMYGLMKVFVARYWIPAMTSAGPTR
jgi:hypothetical protein